MDDMKKLLAGLIVIVAGVFYVTHAHAAAPQLKGQAPGFYRMMLGDFEVVALSDGTPSLPMTKLMTDTTPARVEQMLKRSFLADPVETSVNGYLVNTGDKLAFPNAIVRVDRRDAEFWLSQAIMDGAATDQKDAFKGASTPMRRRASSSRSMAAASWSPGSAQWPPTAIPRVTRFTSSKARDRGSSCWAT